MRKSWEGARQDLYAAASRLGGLAETSNLDVSAALGHTLAEPIHSPVPIPHFDSSAMDGYAVSGPPPWRLLFAPHEASGRENLHRGHHSVAAGTACPVLTGSLLPEGTEGILRSEHAHVNSGYVRPQPGHDIVPGRDIRRTGEELPLGSLLLPAGTLLNPRHIAHLGACGVDTAPVFRPTPVALALTGNEVIERGIPRPGEVRDAFSDSLPALISGWGGAVNHCDRLHDDYRAVEQWIDTSSERLLILTGGSGGSGQDFARRVIEQKATRILASSVEMRPGHPTLLAELPNDRLVLALPGNPLAAYTALYSFAPVALAGLMGREEPAVHDARVAMTVGPLSMSGVRLIPSILRGHMIEPLPRVQSHMLSGLAAADAFALIPHEGADEGAVVGMIHLRSPF